MGTIGSRLKEFRDTKGVSQEEFARQCGVSQGNVTQWETDTVKPARKLHHIINGYPELNIDWLMNGNPPMILNASKLFLMRKDKDFESLKNLRFKEVIEKLTILENTTQKKIAIKLGVAPIHIGALLNGSKPVDDNIIYKLEKNFGVLRSYLVHGIKPIFKADLKGENIEIASEQDVSYTEQKSLFKTDHSIVFLPLKAIADYMTVYKEPGYQNKFEKLLIPNYSHCDTAIEVDGDSMFPTFASRDVLLCKRIDDHDFIEFGRAYVIILHDQQVLFKRIYDHESEEFLTLISDNDTKLNNGKELYPPLKIRKTKIAVIFKVHGSISNNTDGES